MRVDEEKLFSVLSKIGKADEDLLATSPGEAPAITDADDDDNPTLETTGSGEPIDSGDGEPHTDKQVYAKITKKNLWVHHDAHPVVLDVALLSKYGVDWISWEPVTLWREITSDFHVPSISDHTKAKIQAVKTLHINEWFWTKWEVFCWVTQALNNNIPDFQVLQKPSVPQLLNSVYVSEIVRSGEIMSLELQMFVAAAMLDEGVLYAPEPVSFCQDEISLLLKRKNPDSLSLIPAVKDRLSKVGDDSVLEETAVDVQVAKLIVAKKYLELRKRQLHEQMEIIK